MTLTVTYSTRFVKVQYTDGIHVYRQLHLAYRSCKRDPASPRRLGSSLGAGFSRLFLYIADLFKEFWCRHLRIHVPLFFGIAAPPF